MSKWCDACSRNKITGEWQSCSSDCPAFGKYLEELAEMVIQQQAEIDALRWTNKRLVKTEKEKRRELWKKAENDLVDKIASFFEKEENWRELKNCWLEDGRSNDLRSLLCKAIKK